MSQKIRRKKKYDPQAKLQKFVRSRASKVYCYDAKCFDEMKFGGDPLKSALPRNVKKRIMYSVGEDVHHWNIMLLTFESDGKEQWIHDWVLDDLEPAASNNLNTLLDGELEKKVGQRNPNQLICWAWFAVPMKDADLPAMRQEIIDIFTDAGAFDRELCTRVNNARLERESMEKALQAA